MPCLYKDPNGLTVNTNKPKEPRATHYEILYSGGRVDLSFHQGPIDKGLIGLTNEALIAVLIHRLLELNKLYHCEENDLALFHLGAATTALNARRYRQEREK